MKRARIVATLATLIAALVVLVQPAVPLPRQPIDAAVYADAAHHLAQGDGYVTDVDATPRPIYPPGFSLLLAPFARVAYPGGVQVAAKLAAVLLVLLIGWAAYGLGGARAASFAAAIVAVSPFFPAIGRYVMSDGVFAAVAVAMVIVLGRPPTRRTAIVAGVLGSLSLLIRIAGIGTLVSLAGSVGRRWVAWAVIGAVPLVALLGLSQWQVSGNPLVTGYGTSNPKQVFGRVNLTRRNLPADTAFYVERGAAPRRAPLPPPVGPRSRARNLTFYPGVLLGRYWVYSPPLIPLLGLVELWRRRRSRVARFAAAMVATNTAIFLVYEYQSGRFVAPAGSILVVFSAVGLARLSRSAIALRRSAPQDTLAGHQEAAR